MEDSTDQLAFPPWRDNAQETFTKAQVITFLGLAVALILGVIAAGLSLMQVSTFANCVATVLFFVSTCYKFLIAMASRPKVLDNWQADNNQRVVILDNSGKITFADREIEGINPSDLPKLTVLVPVFGEGEIHHDKSGNVIASGEEHTIGPLITHLSALDYPKEKLQILFLVEEKDVATDEVLRRQLTIQNAWEFSEVITVPHAEKRTKPRACNWGLQFTRGEFLVIFDAEDEPEPQQPKKAILAFRKSSPETVCVQAMLAFKNAGTSFLTASFAMEYETHFGTTLPGLARLGLPVPLGGTSNYFRVKFLREVGGWDKYNVTEDFEFCFTILRRKYRIVIMNSTTREEVNNQYKSWLKQRSRWNKGRLVTFFVSMKHPLRFAMSLGPVKFGSFLMEAGIVPMLSMLTPMYWAMSGIYLITGSHFIERLYPQPIYYLGLLSFVGGWAGFFVIVLLAAQKRRLYREALMATLFMPVYSLMQSFAYIVAGFELIARPHHWHKTKHGFVTAQQQKSMLGEASTD